MKVLTFILAVVKLPPSEINSGISAPSLRVCCFKERTNSRDSQTREGWGVAVVTLINLGFFIYQNTTGGNMLTEKQCSNCVLTYSPLDHLALQFTRMQSAIEGASQVIQAEYSNIKPYNAYGLTAQWDDFIGAMERYVKDKGDDPTLIVGE